MLSLRMLWKLRSTELSKFCLVYSRIPSVVPRLCGWLAMITMMCALHHIISTQLNIWKIYALRQLIRYIAITQG